MPCNSDYLNASPEEKVASQVECLLDELAGLPTDTGWWRGYHPRIYNRGTSKKQLDERVALLCSHLQKVDPTKYSLELQIWWRDHQKADAIRNESERQKTDRAALRKQALAKLTAEELEALGVHNTSDWAHE